MLNNWALSLKCEKRLRAPARCPFYLGTESQNMYQILTTLGPIVIIIAIILWIFDDGGKKQDTKLQAEVKQNYDNSVRYDLKEQVRNRLRVSDLKLTNSEVDWVCDQLEESGGIERLEALVAQFKDSPMEDDEESLRQGIIALKNRYREYSEWISYLDHYKALSKSQQEYEIDRMKKNADPQSADDSEKIRVLELVRRGEHGNTEILIGGLKLFTVRKK